MLVLDHWAAWGAHGFLPSLLCVLSALSSGMQLELISSIYCIYLSFPLRVRLHASCFSVADLRKQ